MELKRDDIIKALESCTNPNMDANCSLHCPVGDINACKQYVMYHALSLIKELTEENERLKAENEKFKRTCDDCAGCTEWLCDCANIESHVKADTVRKMQERRASPELTVSY